MSNHYRQVGCNFKPCYISAHMVLGMMISVGGFNSGCRQIQRVLPRLERRLLRPLPQEILLKWGSKCQMHCARMKKAIGHDAGTALKSHGQGDDSDSGMQEIGTEKLWCGPKKQIKERQSAHSIILCENPKPCHGPAGMKPAVMSAQTIHSLSPSCFLSLCLCFFLCLPLLVHLVLLTNTETLGIPASQKRPDSTHGYGHSSQYRSDHMAVLSFFMGLLPCSKTKLHA